MYANKVFIKKSKSVSEELGRVAHTVKNRKEQKDLRHQAEFDSDVSSNMFPSSHRWTCHAVSCKRQGTLILFCQRRSLEKI